MSLIVVTLQIPRGLPWPQPLHRLQVLRVSREVFRAGSVVRRNVDEQLWRRDFERADDVPHARGAGANELRLRIREEEHLLPVDLFDHLKHGLQLRLCALAYSFLLDKKYIMSHW